MTPYRGESPRAVSERAWLAVAYLCVAVATIAVGIATAAYARAGDAWQRCNGVSP